MVITGSVGPVDAQDPERQLIERALGQPVAGVARAAWGFTNRTDMVTLADGRQVAFSTSVQNGGSASAAPELYRHSAWYCPSAQPDAERRLIAA
jgi:hypothetical protein